MECERTLLGNKIEQIMSTCHIYEPQKQHVEDKKPEMSRKRCMTPFLRSSRDRKQRYRDRLPRLLPGVAGGRHPAGKKPALLKSSALTKRDASSHRR